MAIYAFFITFIVSLAADIAVMKKGFFASVLEAFMLSLLIMVAIVVLFPSS